MAPFSAAVAVRRTRQWEVKSDNLIEELSPHGYGKRLRARGAGCEGSFCERLMAQPGVNDCKVFVPSLPLEISDVLLTPTLTWTFHQCLHRPASKMRNPSAI